jgi:hypothetical protein
MVKDERMKLSAFVACLLLSLAVYSTNSMSATTIGDSGYSIESVTGEMPIRTVILKNVGQYFTTFQAYQFDCASQKSKQTGFHRTPEAAQADLSNTILANSIFSWLSDQARLKACEFDSDVDLGSSAHR